MVKRRIRIAEARVQFPPGPHEPTKVIGTLQRSGVRIPSGPLRNAAQAFFCYNKSTMQSMRIVASLLLAVLLIGAALFVTQGLQTSHYTLSPLAYADENDSGGGNERTDAPGNFFFPDPDEGFVPCGKRGTGDTVIGEPCTICHAAEMGQNIITFVIKTVVPVIAVIVAAWGGFEILTAGGNENKYKSGRNRLVKVVIGILIVLLAWAAVNFVLYTFFKDDLIGTWYSFNCSVQPGDPVTGETPEDVLVKSVEIPYNAPPGSSVFSPGEPLSDAQARAQLTAAGIQVRSGVTLEGIRDGVVKEIILFKIECGCSVVVTSATGGSHSPGSGHYQGYKIDIDDTSAASNHILSTFQRCQPPSRTGKYAAELWCHPTRGTVYALEYRRSDQNCAGVPVGSRAPFPSCGQHWDIEVR